MAGDSDSVCDPRISTFSTAELWIISWFIVCIPFRWVMVIPRQEKRFEGKNCGFLAVLSYMTEVREWARVYNNLDGPVKVGSITISRNDVAWPADWKLGRFYNVLCWGKWFWFREPTVSVQREDESPLRLYKEDVSIEDRRNALVIPTYELGLRNTETTCEVPESLREEKNKLILVYGRYVIVVPPAADPPKKVDLTQIRDRQALRTCTLLSFVGFGVLLASLQYRGAHRTLLIIIAVLVGVLLNAVLWWTKDRQFSCMNENQQQLFDKAVENAKEVEAISKVLKDDLRPDGEGGNTREAKRAIDVLLLYRGERSWCRCKPSPSRATQDTWICPRIPGLSTADRFHKLLSVIAHTILPWADCDPPACISLLVVLGVTSFFWRWFGLLVLFGALFLRVFAPDTRLDRFGNGENWIPVWYLLLLQVLTWSMITPWRVLVIVKCLRQLKEDLSTDDGDETSTPVTTFHSTA